MIKQGNFYKRTLINFYDLNFLEFLILFPLLLFVFIFGLYHLGINYLLFNLSPLIFENNFLKLNDLSFLFIYFSQ